VDLPVSSIPRDDITAVILAGGQGSRLGGKVKPLLRKADGTTLLANTERLLMPLVAKGIIAATEATSEALSRHTDWPLVLDPGEGPAVALRHAAGHVDTPWLLLAAGDHPNPNAGLVAALLAAATPDAPAVMFEGQPQWALYRTAAVRAYRGEGRGLRRLAAALGAVQLELGAEHLAALEDVDTKDDCARLDVSD